MGRPLALSQGEGWNCWGGGEIFRGEMWGMSRDIVNFEGVVGELLRGGG